MKKILLFGLVLGASLFYACSSDDDNVDPVINPVARFSFSVSGSNDLQVAFTNSSENASSYAWSFGDSKTSTEESPSHTYSEAGVYEVKLTASNAAGSLSDEFAQMVAVGGVPFASFTWEADENDPAIITFSNNSQNGASFAWDFGDGNTATSENPTHTYTANGEFTVTLTTTNGLGAESVTSQTVSIASPAIALANADFVLQLLHYADVDGNEERALATVDEFSAVVNGLQNDPTYGANTLLVHSGDIIIPGPRFYAVEDNTPRGIIGSNEPGCLDVFFANKIGVQAACIGNHELDAGPGEFFDAAFASESRNGVTFPGSEFPWLAANIDFSNDFDFEDVIGTDGDNVDNLNAKVAKHAVVTINGETIGIIGASTPLLPSITTTGFLEVMPTSSFYLDELANMIQQSVDALENQGVDKIILLAHMQQLSVEKSLARLIDGVDIIVGGGSNTRMGDANDGLFDGDGAFDEPYPYHTTSKSDEPVLVVNVDGDYKYLGRLVVGFDADGHVITESLNEAWNGAYAATDAVVASVGGTANADVIAARDAIDGVIAAQYSNVVGYSSVYLEGRRAVVRTEETNLGNLTADANLWYANLMSDETVHISIKNGGGIRSEIGSAVLPAGSNDPNDFIFSPPADNAVTEGHFRATLRFDNGLCRLTVTAEELKDIMEHAVASSSPGATPGRFPQIGGFSITYDINQPARNGAGTGSRIRELVVTGPNGNLNDVVVSNGTIQGDASRTFNLVTLNFLAEGGDSYPFTESDLPNRNRINFYEGLGFGESVDYPDGDLTQDPGKNAGFSYTGGEQDALAEYFQQFHPTNANAYNQAETNALNDMRIIPAR